MGQRRRGSSAELSAGQRRGVKVQGGRGREMPGSHRDWAGRCRQAWEKVWKSTKRGFCLPFLSPLARFEKKHLNWIALIRLKEPFFGPLPSLSCYEPCWIPSGSKLGALEMAFASRGISSCISRLHARTWKEAAFKWKRTSKSRRIVGSYRRLLTAEKKRS